MEWYVWLAGGALVICGAAIYFTSRKRNLSKEEFGLKFFKRIQKLNPELNLKIDRTDFSISSDDSSRIVNIDNAYKVYLQNPTVLDEIIDRYAAAFSASEPDIKSDAGSLLPVLKDADYYQAMMEGVRKTSRSGDTEKFNLVRIRLNESFDVYLVKDEPQRMAYLNAENLEELGLSAEEAYTIALRNLEKRFEPRITGENGIYVLELDGTYEASMILLPEVMRRAKLLVEGDLLIKPMARDAVVMTGSRRPELIQLANRMGKQVAAENPYFLSGDWLIWQDGVLNVYRPA